MYLPLACDILLLVRSAPGLSPPSSPTKQKKTAMPIEMGLWRLGKKVTRIDFSRIDTESRLEQILANDISIADLKLMLIGRQVPTGRGRIDLLALDAKGNLVVLELKRDRTPREVVAQLLDYGAWIRKLQKEKIAGSFDEYRKKYHSSRANASLDQQFCARFTVREMPDSLNESHRLVVVAAELDDSTERIIGYLADEHEAAINAVFFRFFRDGTTEYLSRAWLIDPVDVEDNFSTPRPPKPPRVKIMGKYSAGPFVRWLGIQGYSFDKAKQIIEAEMEGGYSLKDISIRQELNERREGHPPAEVSEKDRRVIRSKYGRPA